MFYLLQRSGSGQPRHLPPQPQPRPGLRRHLPRLELRVEAGPAPRPRPRQRPRPAPRPLGLQPGLQIQYQLTVRSSDYQKPDGTNTDCPVSCPLSTECTQCTHPEEGVAGEHVVESEGPDHGASEELPGSPALTNQR